MYSKVILKVSAVAISLLVISIYKTAFFELSYLSEAIRNGSFVDAAKPVDTLHVVSEQLSGLIQTDGAAIGARSFGRGGFNHEKSAWDKKPNMIQVSRDLQGSKAMPLHWDLEPAEKRKIRWKKKKIYAWKLAKPLCEEEDTDCEIMGSWQESNNMTCNMIHETDLTDFFADDKDGPVENVRYVARGTVRLTWSFKDFNGTKFAIKTNRVDWDMWDFSPKLIEQHRRDAVISEAVSASPYIVSMYGYCAVSSIYDFSDGGDLKENVVENGPPPGDQMLRIAHRIAASVADLHHVDEFGRATIMHKDIHAKQWLIINGEYYLNDFNYAQLLTWSRKTNSTIPYRRKDLTLVRVMPN
jgi:serine/threonine protein kinase